MCMRCERASTMAQQGLKMQYLACSCTSKSRNMVEASGTLWARREGLGIISSGGVLVRGRRYWTARKSHLGRRWRTGRLYPGKSTAWGQGIPSLCSSESRCLDPGVLCNMGGAAPRLTLVRRAKKSPVMGDKPPGTRAVPDSVISEAQSKAHDVPSWLGVPGNVLVTVCVYGRDWSVSMGVLLWGSRGVMTISRREGVVILTQVPLCQICL